MKKSIDIKDIERAQALKQGESLISNNYIITCKKSQSDFIIEFVGRGAK